MKLEDLTVESIAQMTQEQRDAFILTFIKKWPVLASHIADQISFELRVEEMEEGKI
tara:strand:- start:281 stop:448 length:168 start_codon:yes stop_codon:yes gene_type:complete